MMKVNLSSIESSKYNLRKLACHQSFPVNGTYTVRLSSIDINKWNLRKFICHRLIPVNTIYESTSVVDRFQ